MVAPHPRERVWLRDANGIREASAVPPAAWQGECDCVVGPFTCVPCAHAFLRLRGVRSGSKVFASRSAYYVRLLA